MHVDRAKNPSGVSDICDLVRDGWGSGNGGAGLIFPRWIEEDVA
jgi:hypothetical protein